MAGRYWRRCTTGLRRKGSRSYGYASMTGTRRPVGYMPELATRWCASSQPTRTCASDLVPCLPDGLDRTPSRSDWPSARPEKATPYSRDKFATGSYKSAEPVPIALLTPNKDAGASSSTIRVTRRAPGSRSKHSAGAPLLVPFCCRLVADVALTCPVSVAWPTLSLVSSRVLAGSRCRTSRARRVLRAEPKSTTTGVAWQEEPARPTDYSRSAI